MPGLEKSPPWPRGPGPWRDRPGRTQPPAGLPEKPAESVLYAYIPRFAAFSGAVFFLTLAGGRRARHRLTQEAWSLDFCATIDTAANGRRQTGQETDQGNDHAIGNEIAPCGGAAVVVGFGWLGVVAGAAGRCADHGRDDL